MAKKIGVADGESDPFRAGRVSQMFLWGFYSDEHGQLYFENTNEFIEFLRSLGKEYRVYMHNGGKFDFHYLLHGIEDWSKIMIIAGRLAKFHIGETEMVDSYCILPVPLSAYQKTKIDYALFEKEERDKPENKKLIYDYLKDDCVFLHELVTEFIKENGYALTIASSAIKKLQKIEGIKIEDSGKDFFDNVRPYYFGGRVQCFKKGIIKGDIQFIDINSAYPFAMKHEHPWGTYFATTEKNPQIKGHNFYTVKCLSKGALPFRDLEGRLGFPADNTIREYNVTGWELLAGLKHGAITELKHIKQLVFFETRNYSKYVDYYYMLKATSAKNSPEYIFSKLYLNAAYGKFAADPCKYREYYICSNDEMQNAIEQGFYVHGEIHDKIVVSKANEEDTWRFYNMAIAASITGFVRAYLFNAIMSVETPLYCDTDSLLFIGKHSLELHPSNLGAWDLEGTFTQAGIAGKKSYALYNAKTKEKKHRFKGMKLTYDEVMRICKGEKITKMPDVPIYSIKKGIYFLPKTLAQT